MDDWVVYLAQPAAQVVPLRAGRRGAGGWAGASEPDEGADRMEKARPA
jgi:hypothetical protein